MNFNETVEELRRSINAHRKTASHHTDALNDFDNRLEATRNDLWAAVHGLESDVAAKNVRINELFEEAERLRKRLELQSERLFMQSNRISGMAAEMRVIQQMLKHNDENANANLEQFRREQREISEMERQRIWNIFSSLTDRVKELAKGESNAQDG